MSESIVVALITGILALVGTIITSSATSKLTAYKIEELRGDFADLRDRVNKHNNLVERVTIVEQSTKSAHKRIDGIEKTRSDRPD